MGIVTQSAFSASVWIYFCDVRWASLNLKTKNVKNGSIEWSMLAGNWGTFIMTTQLKCQKLIAASCCIFLSMVVVTTKVSAQQQDLFSFRSTSAPGGPFIYWAGANDHTCASQDWHCVGKASLYLPTITGHYPAATFRQVPGLVGDGTISFRTSTDRDWYITHNGSEVSIIRDTGTASFRERASFLPIPVGSVGENFFSYAAFTDRGSFLSRSGKQLIMAASDNTDQFREDSKFIRVEPLWDGSP